MIIIAPQIVVVSADVAVKKVATGSVENLLAIVARRDDVTAGKLAIQTGCC